MATTNSLTKPLYVEPSSTVLDGFDVICYTRMAKKITLAILKTESEAITVRNFLMSSAYLINNDLDKYLKQFVIKENK